MLLYDLIIAHAQFKRNKIFILLRSLLRNKSLWKLHSEPLRSPLRPALWAQLRDRAQSQQNNGFVSFAYQTVYSFRQIVPDKHITSRPVLSTHFTTGAGPSAPIFGLQLLIGHSINHGHMNIIMIQCPPHSVKIAVLLHKFTGVYLACGVRSNVLW